MNLVLRRRLPALLAALIVACARVTAPAGERTLSVIDPGGAPPGAIGIDIPDTVAGGSPLAVKFYTWGSSSCTIADGEDVTVIGQTVRITSYDAPLPANAVCTSDLRRFERHTTVHPPTGPVTFELRGRLLSASPGDTITLTRVVVVE